MFVCDVIFVFLVLPPQEGPPNKKPKNNHESSKKEKKNKSPAKEHKKSENEVTVEVSNLNLRNWAAFIHKLEMLNFGAKQ